MPVGPEQLEDADDLRTAVARSAAPPIVELGVQRLAETRPGLTDELEADGSLRAATIAVLAASRSLTRLLEADPTAIEVLRHLDDRAPVEPADVHELRAGKDRELLRIAARDLLGRDDLETTTSLLSRLAGEVLQASASLAGADDLAIIGMGKLGADELNYASDVDLMFVGDGDLAVLERLAREVMEHARNCYRVDATLRPEGRSGNLVRTIDSYEAYWDRWAEPWEFQALLKARPVAGDALLGGRFLDTAQRWLWNRPFDADDLRSIRELKQRAEAEVSKKGLQDRDVKHGRGGIRDIEFAVQLLQLVHGQVDAGLRQASTLDALAELAAAGYVDGSDAEELRGAYGFLRDVEHRLQLVDEQQVHTVPTDPDAVERLARVLGYRDSSHGSARERFDQDLRSERLAVRLIHERLYFRPLLEAFAGVDGALTPEAAATRLTAFGFTDAVRTQAAVRELTTGLNRSSRLMQQLLPLLLDWLSQAPDPDLGLLMLRNVLGGPQRDRQLGEVFRESPEVARRLCTVLGTSRLLGDLLIRNPDIVPRLAEEERLRTRPRNELVQGAERAVIWRDEVADRQMGLLRWNQRHVLGVAARDVFEVTDIRGVGSDLSAIAEASLDVALRSLEPSVPFAVVALGRFGGAELSYASDLDVVFVYDGTSPKDFEEAERLGRSLLRFVNGATPAERIYEIDADLRPEGKQGPLARSLDGFAGYFDRWAETWERQAFVRARPVAGDLDLGTRLLDTLSGPVWEAPFGDAEVRDIRRMKARVEAERMPVGEDREFHLKLGRGSLSDIEWTAQLLQLRHGVRATGTRDALTRLEAGGHLAADDAEVLVEAYEFLERTRNRLYLVGSDRGDSLPNQPEHLTWLARSLGISATDLRSRYRQVTRRSRRVFERVFYDRG